MILSLKYYPAPGPCLNNIRNLSDIYQNLGGGGVQQYAANTYIKKSYIYTFNVFLIDISFYTNDLYTSSIYFNYEQLKRTPEFRNLVY